MSKKLIFKKPFAYKKHSKDDVQLHWFISPYGEGMFKDIDWRLYDDSTLSRIGIDLKRHKRTNRNNPMLNKKKHRIT